jgi:hypothetical protein
MKQSKGLESPASASGAGGSSLLYNNKAKLIRTYRFGWNEHVAE